MSVRRAKVVSSEIKALLHCDCGQEFDTAVADVCCPKCRASFRLEISVYPPLYYFVEADEAANVLDKFPLGNALGQKEPAK